MEIESSQPETTLGVESPASETLQNSSGQENNIFVVWGWKKQVKDRKRASELKEVNPLPKESKIV